MPPLFARWRSEDRSQAASWMVPWRSTTPSASRRRRPRASTPHVAGDPDILLAPDLEAGNILAKATHLPGQCRQRRAGAGGQGADHPHQPGRQCAVTNRQLRRRHAGGSCAAKESMKDASMDDYALVLNAGSSSLKFCVFRRPAGKRWQLEARGQIEGIGTSPRLSAKDAEGQSLADEQSGCYGSRRARRHRCSGRLAPVQVWRRREC